MVSVEYQPNDMTAREEMMSDENGRQCAVLRISTKNLTTAEREGFYFECDYASWVVERRIVGGELWLWVSPGLKVLKIFHNDLGNIEMHISKFGVGKIESLMVYKVVIQGTMSDKGKGKTANQQFLAFQITPHNATLEVDGKLWPVDAEGNAQKYVHFGTYSYTVRAANYFTKEGKVTVDDPDNTVFETVTLVPDFTEVTLTVDANAEIWVNNEKKGVRTWTGALGNDTYRVECRKANHEPGVTTVEITPDKAGQTIKLTPPKPFTGSLLVESSPSLCKLFIDGQEYGVTPKSIGDMAVGQHEIKLTKDGYIDFTQKVVITKDAKEQVTATLKSKLKPDTPKQNKPKLNTPKKEKPKLDLMTFSQQKLAFLTANAAYSMAPQTSFGATFGSVDKMGWFATVMNNFQFGAMNPSYTCDSEGYVDGEFPLYSGETTSWRLSLMGGLVVRAAGPLCFRFGAGYGSRYGCLVTNDGTPVKVTDNSAAGLDATAGLQLNLKGFTMSVDAVTTNFNTLEVKLGLGICWLK